MMLVQTNEDQSAWEEVIQMDKMTDAVIKKVE